MQIQPVNKVAIPQLISEQIEDFVISGKLIPGEKLPSEAVLCKQFSASRTAVREAIAGLVSKGLLERRNNGVFVKHIDIDNMLDIISLMISTNNITMEQLLEARITIEVENARLAAIRATDEDLEKIYVCISHNNSSEDATVRALAAEFHRTVAKSTHNPILECFYQVIYEAILKDPRPTMVLRESAGQHRAIYEKIRDHDAEGARKEMQKHLDNVKISSI